MALRSYVPQDHESKHQEIGSEQNPAAFIDMLLGLTAEWGRVLAAHGSIAIELGDTYSGGNSAGPNGYGPATGYDADTHTNQPIDTRTGGGGGPGWPLAKSLALIPQLYAVALAYGINPLTGAPSPAGRWLVRNVIVWHRPNPAVGALGDKVRPSTSYIVVATRSPKRWFDLTAVRGEPGKKDGTRLGSVDGHELARVEVGLSSGNGWTGINPAGAPPLDCWLDEYDSQIVEGGGGIGLLHAEACSADSNDNRPQTRPAPSTLSPDDHYDGTHDTWTLTTQPSRLAHYAMWPAKLAERLILSMCPREVCRVCGEPRRRMETSERTNRGALTTLPIRHPGRASTGGGEHVAESHTWGSIISTLGWSDCGHDNFRPGVTLDPFAGTFTTGLVAEYHDRDAIGIDFDPRNRDLVPMRREEVRRALNPTHIRTINGQMGMFDEVPA